MDLKHILTRYRSWSTRRDSRALVHRSAKIDGMHVSYSGENLVRIGEGSIVRAQFNFERDGARISVGDNTFVGASVFVAAERIEIGSDVLIAWGSTFSDHDSHALKFEDRAKDVRDWYNGCKNWSNVKRAPIVVQDKAWIGFGCTILKGVTIGTEAVVAAGSVVTRSVEPRTMIGGNPARVIRVLD